MSSRSLSNIKLNLRISATNINTLDDAIECVPLWDISNGVTLCKECHKQTDNYGWKSNSGVK